MTHLILTVGTGTAGAHSNLAAGLRRTLELIAPEKFWLVPSTDEVSQLTADLVREGVPGFQAWAASHAYRSIARPDSLEDCRQSVREVILRARQALSEAESQAAVQRVTNVLAPLGLPAIARPSLSL